MPNPKTSKSTVSEPVEPLSGIAKRRNAARLDSTPEYLVRRDRLIEAAAQVFRNRGYSRTTLGEVAEVADIERPNIYYYVANKRELFIEVLKRTMLYSSDINLENISGVNSAADRLRILMIEMMERYERHYPYLYLGTQENLSFLTDEDDTTALAEQIETIGQRQFAAIRQVLKEGTESGEFRSNLSPGVLAEAVIGAFAWSSRWFDPGSSRFSGTELGAAFSDILLHGLLGGPQQR